MLSTAQRLARGLCLFGVLDRPSTPGALSYTLAVYASRACAAAGHGPGEILLGTQLITLPSPSSQGFDVSIGSEPLAVGTSITATVTNAAGSTSEMSACISLGEAAGRLQVSNANDSGAGSLRDAITQSNSDPDADVITFAIPGSGMHQIPIASVLPTITQPVLIDGYTQPGAQANTDLFASNAQIRIHLDRQPSANGNGLGICAPAVTVRGLAISGFAQSQIGVGQGGDGNCGR